VALRPFSHATPATLEEAEALLGESGGRKAVAIAGGTDLLGALKDGIHPAYPHLLVDLKRLPGLGEIKEDRRGLHLGALVTLAEVADHPAIRERYPALAAAAGSVATPQVRNLATLGGNICQEARCWYYRYPENYFYCSRKGGNACPAVMGENRFHSIFGAMRAIEPPCSQECPAHVDIAAYLALMRRGEADAAADLVLAANPMPAITGRVCPHYCEAACNRGLHDEAVSVRSIERGIGDRVLARPGRFYPAPRRRSGKRVAVVGAGPAGLSAAYFLRRLGHEVTVYDAMPEAGGMLTYGIPAYRLPAEVVGRQVAAFAGMGIVFRLGERVGERGRSLQTLRRSHDAVFLATGAWAQRDLGLAHEDLLTPGLDFLRGIRQGSVGTVGRRVLVIGGGNVALDVAVSAARLGAEAVTVACLERRDEMPAFPEDVEQAFLERVEILPSWGPHRVKVRGQALAGMELARCTSVFDAAGRFAPVLDPSQRISVDADQVVLAIGQTADLGYVGRSLKTESGRVATAADTGATSVAGVFAGGDAAHGAATVVSALAAGRRGALNIDRHLGGPGAAGPGRSRRPGFLELNPSAGAPAPRSQEEAAPPQERSIREEDSATLPWSTLEGEARRCFNCGGCVAVNAGDLAPVLLALGARVRTTRRVLPAEAFFAVGPGTSTALAPGELVRGIDVPLPEGESRQCYLKFRTRHSIDFPIAGVAAAVRLHGGVVARARLALGAVAPIPLRATAAEESLEGGPLDEASIERAAALAVAAAAPLGENRYKVTIVETLVRRALQALASP
jgi:NADPH-dependent glutamate synthase beta subunit-like oxidoreductase/CO/xanthine dehydrogenase FAD-binding subunit